MTWLEKLKYLNIHIELLLHLKRDVTKILEMQEAKFLSDYLNLKDVTSLKEGEGWCLVLFLKAFMDYNLGKSTNFDNLIRTYSKSENEGQIIFNCVYDLKILGYIEIDEGNEEFKLKTHIANMVCAHQIIPKPDKHQLRINKSIAEIENLKYFGKTMGAMEKRHNCLNELHEYLNEHTEIANAFKLNHLQQIDRLFVLLTLVKNCSGITEFSPDDIDLLALNEAGARYLRKQLLFGSGPVFDNGFLIKIPNHQQSDSFKIELTKEFFSACNLKDIKPLSRIPNNEKSNGKIDISSLPQGFFTLFENRKIKEEQLYFNEEVSSKIELFKNLLKNDDELFREDEIFNGKLLLFFEGLPGSGKTAVAYQMAKETNRDLLLINWQTVNQKWVGESEKSLRSILNGIDKVSKNASRKPIVLLNEADSFLSRRVIVGQSADQSKNNMVSMLLEWMERNDPFSILIFTANHKELLDSAFERRLIQISFDCPDQSTRINIWQSLSRKYGYDLSEDDLNILASTNISGAEIQKSFRNYRMHQLAFKIAEFDLSLFLKCSGQQLWLQRSSIGFRAAPA